jgi:hypothetical protein
MKANKLAEITRN